MPACATRGDIPQLMARPLTPADPDADAAADAADDAGAPAPCEVMDAAVARDVTPSSPAAAPAATPNVVLYTTRGMSSPAYPILLLAYPTSTTMPPVSSA